MGKDLYLITDHGESHEDHIPIGVYDFDGLNSRYEIVALYNVFTEKYTELTKEDVDSWDDNTWYELTVIEFDFYDDDDGVCEFFETQNKDGEYDDVMLPVWIIKIGENKEMPGT